MTIKVTADVTVVKAPDLKFSNAGKAWTSIRCLSKQRRNNNGKWEDSDPTWVSVIVFGKAAEMLIESGVDKGSRLLVTGRMESREWQANDGEKRTTLEITADNVALDLTFTAYTKVGEGRHAQAPQSSSDPFVSDESPF